VQSAAWRVLRHLLKNRSHEVVVPEVVVREVVGRFAAQLQDKVRALTNATRDLQRLGVQTSAEFARPSPDEILAAYETRLRQYLRSARVLVGKPPADIDLLELVNRAIYRQKPFDNHRSGFRDAIN
jgi:hypothetical protein